jgi:hypothetical protein
MNNVVPFNREIHSYLVSLHYSYERVEGDNNEPPEHDSYEFGYHAVVVIGNLAEAEWERARKTVQVSSSGTPILPRFHKWLLARKYEHEQPDARLDMYYGEKDMVVVYFPEDYSNTLANE